MCHSIIVSVRETCADWIQGVQPRDDPALHGKKDGDDNFHIRVNRRNVGPSSTQVGGVSLEYPCGYTCSVSLEYPCSYTCGVSLEYPYNCTWCITGVST